VLIVPVTPEEMDRILAEGREHLEGEVVGAKKE